MLQRDAAAKGIVFSQFTSMLDLIGFCLQKVGNRIPSYTSHMDHTGTLMPWLDLVTSVVCYILRPFQQ